MFDVTGGIWSTHVHLESSASQICAAILKSEKIYFLGLLCIDTTAAAGYDYKSCLRALEKGVGASWSSSGSFFGTIRI